MALASEFWREQVSAVPPAKRLLLLPHCLRPADGCPAEYSQFGLIAAPAAGAASRIFAHRGTAGIPRDCAEGSPVVMQIILAAASMPILASPAQPRRAGESTDKRSRRRRYLAMYKRSPAERMPEQFGRHGLGQTT